MGEVAEWCLWSDTTPRPGWANMAVDSALLERAGRDGTGWLRLYGWSPHCLSFGRHEPATRRYDIGRIRALRLDVVRRPTGGRAVWHARELTYAVAAPPAWFGSLRAAYRAIHEVLRRALVALGADATLAPEARAPGLDAGACFAQPAGGEVMVGGRKVIGSAQLRGERAFLQHGSILLEDDQATVGAVSRGTAPAGLAVPLAVPLAALLGRTVPRDEVARAVAAAAMDVWPDRWHGIGDVDGILAEASRHYPRFQSAEWTWSR